MERVPPVSGLGVHPATLTKRYDYSLSPEVPVYASSNLYAEEMPLEVDVHEGVEVGILLVGRQERHLDDLVIPALPGDVWLSATWEPHGWRTTMPNTRDVVLIFLPEFLGEEQLGELSWLSLFAAPPGQRPRVTTPETRARVLALGYDLLREIEEERPAWRSALRLDLLRLLLTLSRNWKPPAMLDERSRVSARNLPRIMPALVLVHSQPERRVSVAEAAATCGLSRAQFCLVFQNAMGMSFGKFCRRLRLGLVAQRLLATDLPTAAIAEQTGFADSSHLHRAFVKHYRCTPGQYREQNRIN